MTPHGSIYRASRLYEKAFGFRDFDREVRFLRDAFSARRKRPATSLLELAAGPARHAIDMATAGLNVAALDLSSDMRQLALTRARERQVSLAYSLGDMIDFRAGRRFDLIVNLLSSITYILRDDDFVAHLHCVADALVDDGMYVVEFPHPSTRHGHSTVKDTWTVADEEGVLEASWRSVDWQGTTSVCIATMRFQPTQGDPVVVRGEARERVFSLDEVTAFAKATKRLEVEDVFGAMEEGVTLDAKNAWRMVMMFRKTSARESGDRP